MKISLLSVWKSYIKKEDLLIYTSYNEKFAFKTFKQTETGFGILSSLECTNNDFKETEHSAQTLVF